MQGTTNTTITGVALNYTFFSSFAIIDIIVPNNQHQVILYEPKEKQNIRSLRRSIKLGDQIQCTGIWETVPVDITTIRPTKRLRVTSIPTCLKMRAVNAETLQRLKVLTFGPPKPSNKRKRQKTNSTPSTTTSTTTTATMPTGHSSKTNPREKGRIFAQFVIDKMKGIEKLNQGTGVIDVAGGGGHVSLAFALAGVKSTVVDPRDSCGMLPKRDRKMYRRALKNNALVIKFDTFRAWFGGQTVGADDLFSGGNDDVIDTIPNCGTTKDKRKSQELMSGCSCICAMHPDEATEAAIDYAILHNKPFFVTPCCIFSRLFPDRILHNGQSVETTSDFVRYLLEKHQDIKIDVLGIDGANQCVYWTGRS